MLTGISGSKTLRSWSQMAAGSGAPSASVAAVTVWTATVSPIASASLPSRRKSPVEVWMV